MKQLLYLSFTAFALWTIMGCEKTEVSELQDPNDKQASPAVYTLKMDKDVASIDAIDLEHLDLENIREQGATSSHKKSNSSVQHANGIVTTSTPNTLVFSAVKNKGGTHGKNNLDGAYFNKVKFNSECLTVAGNQGYFGGAITAWEAGAGFPQNAPPVSAGWELYMAVEDNGEGKNAEDAFGGGLVFFPPGTTLSDIEQQNGFSKGFFQSQGIHSKCDFAAFLYKQGKVPYVFVPGEEPTNVQVK